MSGIVVDFTTARGLLKPEADAPPDQSTAATPRESRTVSVERPAFDACRHRQMSIDSTQRTVKCGACGMWLDPVWCLKELFNYYESRIDERLESIEAFEQKQREAQERKDARRRAPTAALRKRREESLERAAWNEYQAKLLTLRAGRQREQVAKIDKQLASSVADGEERA